MNEVRFKKVSVSELNLREDYIQKYIADNPSSIGLGNLELIEKERAQPSGGRLDLLLKNPDTNKRYEVEIQLNETDPSHIIRTLEYWDIERKRYPQYEHCAVIIAEDITNRFFNVISLFNGFIPLIAIQVNAYRIVEEEKFGLIFTRILDQSSIVSFAEETKQEQKDEKWWSSLYPNTLKYAKKVLDIINAENDENEKYELNYVKSYIGLKKYNRVNNIFTFSGRKDAFVVINVHLSETTEMDDYLKDKEITTLSYDAGFHNYRLKFMEDELCKEETGRVIKEIFEIAEREYNE